MIEVHITVKDNEISLKEKFVVEEPFEMSQDDAVLERMVTKVLDQFKGDQIDRDIKIVTTMFW